jgi:hypothetical protein
MAKIVFNDGTNYTVKQDSLIVIEENSANERQQTNVSVNVNTGTVDLATGTYLQGSKSTVVMDGVTARLSVTAKPCNYLTGKRPDSNPTLSTWKK